MWGRRSKNQWQLAATSQVVAPATNQERLTRQAFHATRPKRMTSRIRLSQAAKSAWPSYAAQKSHPQSHE